jgi:hypothetical protein
VGQVSSFVFWEDFSEILKLFSICPFVH